MSWFTRAFGYGLGRAAGQAIFGEDQREKSAVREPIQPKTEAEILADEKRFDAEAKKLDADQAAARAAKSSR